VDRVGNLVPPARAKWRVGRKVGRTVYIQTGEEPSNLDILIGMMDSPELAALAVKAVNEHLDRRHAENQRASRPTEEA
jgi:hypothetical protein